MNRKSYRISDVITLISQFVNTQASVLTFINQRSNKQTFHYLNFKPNDGINTIGSGLITERLGVNS